jgi:hypothetical protein
MINQITCFSSMFLPPMVVENAPEDSTPRDGVLSGDLLPRLASSEVDAELDLIQLEDKDAAGVLHLVQLRDALELGLRAEGR